MIVSASPHLSVHCLHAPLTCVPLKLKNKSALVTSMAVFFPLKSCWHIAEVLHLAESKYGHYNKHTNTTMNTVSAPCHSLKSCHFFLLLFVFAMCVWQFSRLSKKKERLYVTNDDNYSTNCIAALFWKAEIEFCTWHLNVLTSQLSSYKPWKLWLQNSSARENWWKLVFNAIQHVFFHLCTSRSGGWGYLVEAPSCRILLAGSELLQLSIQDVHQLLHKAHWGADVPGKDGAFGVLG